MTIIESAHAKINLGLKIVDRRTDGFHSILSIFQTVDISDTLEMTGSLQPGLRCSDSMVPDGPDNLVLKAETALLVIYPQLPKLRFDLKKQIPIGAGLGGGSADAAATLRGLVGFHRLDITQEKLAEIAGEVGSDVPFFLTGGTAIVSGRGEVIEPVEWPFHFTYVLVYPGFTVSTAWAYGQLGKIGTGLGLYREMLDALRDGTLHREDLKKALVNDFEEPIFASHPMLSEVKQRLIDHGAIAAVMSGSGSTMIGVFESELNAFHSANMLNIAYGKQFSIFTVPATVTASVSGQIEG